MTGNWRDRAATSFQCQKQPASGSRGMVVSNHPLASSAGAEMLAAGGNAIDAAIATLFTLTVVEPMMVGIIGGGMAHIRLADGSHRFIDGQSTVPLAVRPDTYTSKPGSAHDVFDTVGDENLNGPKAVAVPGSLKAWCETLQRFGTMSLADVMQPAIKHAARGYAATPYLHECIADSAGEMLKDKAISAIYLPNGDAAEGRRARGAVGICGDADLHLAARRGRAVSRAARRHPRRLHEDEWRLHHPRGSHGATRPSSASRSGPIIAAGPILGPPPPAASGVHIAQMLNILEGYDIAKLGFGTRRDDPLSRRSAEDRLCRSRRRQRRSGFRQRAGGAADVEGLCRRAPPRDRSEPRAGMGRRRGAARRRAHHAHDGGGCVRQRGRDHADHQQSVRREDPDSRARHHRRTIT